MLNGTETWESQNGFKIYRLSIDFQIAWNCIQSYSLLLARSFWSHVYLPGEHWTVILYIYSLYLSKTGNRTTLSFHYDELLVYSLRR